ncbi:MAG: hypothetical protein Q9228_003835 [Teloschistes exilis]
MSRPSSPNGSSEETVTSHARQKEASDKGALSESKQPSSHDSEHSPSFLGFRNLMVIVLVVMNLRLVVENFQKYGVLICLRCHDYRRHDLMLSTLLYALVPCHLFVAYVLELGAAQHAKGVLGRLKRSAERNPDSDPLMTSRAFQATWYTIAWAHGINASFCLLVTTFTVYYHIHHPLIGIICQIHATIVWLKNCSYAFTNRDLRHAYLYPQHTSWDELPELYSQCPYPQNVTIGNLAYFWWAPTLVYQPIYPRTPSIRWTFVAKRLAECASLSIFIWLASAQYAAPLLHNSLSKISTMDVPSILERLMKLSTVSLVIWLAGFFAVFQSVLNALAEIMRFGDREFYTEWWNSPSVGNYWRTWNKPVYHFMRRHIYSPLVGRGFSSGFASLIVFVFSGLLHELLVGVPTHNILGVAFAGMVVQLPMIAMTTPLERMEGVNGRVVGNCIFWISFCLVGQPLAALIYFFAWQAKYGSLSKQKV